MADSELANLTEDTAPLATDWLYKVDSAGTVDRKVSYKNLLLTSAVQTVAATGATETLDTSLYSVFDMTMDQACLFTFSNPAPSGRATIFTLILRGAFTPTLPASVDWGDAAPPTYTTPSMYVFVTVNGGTTYLGVQNGKAFG